MTMESLYLLFLLFLILLFVFPFTFTIKASYNFLDNYGSVAVRMWFFSIIVAKIKRKGVSILIMTEKKNTKKDLELGEKQLQSIKNFKEEVSNKLKIRKVNFYSHIGSTNPFSSAIISSSFSIFVSIIISRLKVFQPTGKFVHKNKTDFYNNKFAFAITMKTAISLFDIIYSMISAFLKVGQKANI